jgi:toxin ParE1/3/4
MNRYTVGPKARRDLTEIYKYIARDSFSTADHVYDALLQTFCTLARHPLMGEAREDLAKDLRMFTSGKYVILFQPTQRGIRVVRVIHSARDLLEVWRKG